MPRDYIKSAAKELQKIPGVGVKFAQDLIDLGIHCVGDLRGHVPEELYQRLCRLRGKHLDRCVLYQFRCAVYFASTAHPEAQLLKWWSWKDQSGGK
jgi:hypothetical protein